MLCMHAAIYIVMYSYMYMCVSNSQPSPVLHYMKQKNLEYFKKLDRAQDGTLHGEKENSSLKEIFYITTSQAEKLVTNLLCMSSIAIDSIYPQLFYR